MPKSGDQSKRLLDLIGKVYDAALDECLFPGVAQEIAGTVVSGGEFVSVVLKVLSGGVASGTVLEGGTEIVHGAASGGTIHGGLVEVASGGLETGTVAFVSGGTLQLDAGASFAGGTLVTDPPVAATAATADRFLAVALDGVSGRGLWVINGTAAEIIELGSLASDGAPLSSTAEDQSVTDLDSRVLTGDLFVTNAGASVSLPPAGVTAAARQDTAASSGLLQADAAGGPNQPTTLFKYVGFIYYANNTDHYLTPDGTNGINILADMGSNTIDLTWNILEATATSNIMEENGSLAGLSKAIDYAESLGLQVALKPMIGFMDGTSGGGFSVNPTDPAVWFAHYQRIVVQYAKLAQQDHVALFTIGTELGQLDRQPQYLPYWTSLIDAVRQVYSGELTYAAATVSDQNFSNPNAAPYMPDKVDFWNQLDIIGVDAYPILTTSAPTSADEVAAGWSSDAYGNDWIAYLHSLSTTFGKPVMLAEVGFDSSTDAYKDPEADSAADPGRPDNLQQEYLYQGTYQALTDLMSPSKFYGLTQWAETSYPADVNSGPLIDTSNGIGVFGKPSQYLLASSWGATDYMGWSDSSFTGSIANDRIALYGDQIANAPRAANGALITRAETFDTTISLIVDGTIINGSVPTLKVVVNATDYATLALKAIPSGYVDSLGIPSTTDQTFTMTVPGLVTISQLQIVFGSPVNVGGPENSSAFIVGASVNGVALSQVTYTPAQGSAKPELIDDHNADGDSSLFDGGSMLVDASPWNTALAANQWGSATQPIQVDGNGGTDIVDVLGAPADYKITQISPGTVTLTENSGLRQNAVLTDGIQYISFLDGATYDIASVITTIVVSAGHTSSGVTVRKGVSEIVLSGGTARSTVVLTGGTEIVSAGGWDFTAKISGSEFVRGTATSATVYGGGNQYVSAGGTASAAVVHSGGIERVQGVASGATISNGGHQIVSSGGVASGTTIKFGGKEIVSAGGTTRGSVLSGGTETVSGAAHGGVLNGGLLEVASGGVASGTITFLSGGTLQLDAGASFPGAIAGFGKPDLSDRIDLRAIAFGAGTKRSFKEAAGSTSGTLTVTDGTHSVHLALFGSYKASNFTLSTDNNGGTRVTDPPVAGGASRLTFADLSPAGALNRGNQLNFRPGALATSEPAHAGQTLLATGPPDVLGGAPHQPLLPGRG